MAYDILLVEDEEPVRASVADTLRDAGYGVRAVAGSAEALELIEAEQPKLALLDVWLEGSEFDGAKLLGVIRQRYPDLPVVMISGHGTIEVAVETTRQGAYDFIEKPFATDRLLTTVRRAIDDYWRKVEIAQLRLRRDEHSELIGVSTEVGRLRSEIERVAPSGSRVLIEGPAGSGKEVVARMIHNYSERREGPFVVAACATMDPDRLEADLFGGEEDGARAGLLEQADGGTLLLDEVADMPADVQARLARMLHDQGLGDGRRSSPGFDARVLASSNRDLGEAVAAGGMREDLYYRLNVVPIRIPPLRDRREDIPLLVHHFVDLFARSRGRPRPDVAPDAMAALQAYDWPGNVRELRNLVERLSILGPGDGEAFRADDLPGEVRERAPEISRLEKGGEMMSLPLREAREAFEREYLLVQLNRHGGNISRTAQFVGMERSALHRKLKSLDVQVGADRRD